MKITIFLFCCILLVSCSVNESVTVRPDIMALAEKIAVNKTVCGPAVGYAGIEPEEWKGYVQLEKLATESELLLLCENKDPVIRCYSFKALENRNPGKAFPVLINHISDNELVATQYGCIGSQAFVGDEFLDNYDFNYVGEDASNYYAKLSAGQRQQIQEILLTAKNIRLTAKTSYLLNLTPNESQYQRIKEIVLTEDNPGALMALAKYQKQEDLSIIASWLQDPKKKTHGLMAVGKFPDQSFLPNLIAIFDNEWKEKLYDYPLWRYLIIAMAKYPDTKVRDKFEMILHTNDKYRYKYLSPFLFVAIKKSGSDYYENLLRYLKFDESEMQEINSYL